MSLYHLSQPTAQHSFRRGTDGHATMAGVQYVRFVCSCCCQSKPQAGRKRVSANPKDGYLCADCQTCDMASFAGQVKPGRDYSLALRDALQVVIARRALTMQQIAIRLGRSMSVVRRVVKRLHDDDAVHISGWTRDGNKTGKWMPQWSWGDGVDAPKPKPASPSQRCERWRVKQFGAHHLQPVQMDPLMRALFGRS